MLTNLMGLQHLQNTDLQNALTVQAQIAAENQKQQMERWKLLQDTQTAIFEMQQEVTVNKAQVQDKACKKWDDYIRG
ncbi:MAG: hypothetical protein EB084_12005 [Proteobacteria bacterium]|nr:hypothetical protein [Pseudomonadota bacterium]